MYWFGSALGGKFLFCQANDAPNAVGHHARGNRRPRNSVDVFTDTDWIVSCLVGELLCELVITDRTSPVAHVLRGISVLDAIVSVDNHRYHEYSGSGCDPLGGKIPHRAGITFYGMETNSLFPGSREGYIAHSGGSGEVLTVV